MTQERSQRLTDAGISTLDEYVIFLCLNRQKPVDIIHKQTGVDLSVIDSFCSQQTNIIESQICGNLTYYQRTEYGEKLALILR